MEPIRLILVRHGNTFEDGAPVVWVGAQTDMPLTAKGKEQAQLVGALLQQQDTKPAAIFFGPLVRQKESAEIIAQLLDAQTQLEESALLTEVDYGPWEGLSNEEIEAKWPGALTAWQNQLQWPVGVFPGSKEEMFARLHAFVAQIRAQVAPGETVVAVTSNGIMRLIVALVHAPQAPTDFSSYKVKTGNYSVLEIYPDHIAIISWNQTPIIS